MFEANGVSFFLRKRMMLQKAFSPTALLRCLSRPSLLADREVIQVFLLLYLLPLPLSFSLSLKNCMYFLRIDFFDLSSPSSQVLIHFDVFNDDSQIVLQSQVVLYLKRHVRHYFFVILRVPQTQIPNLNITLSLHSTLN